MGSGRRETDVTVLCQFHTAAEGIVSLSLFACCFVKRLESATGHPLAAASVKAVRYPAVEAHMGESVRPFSPSLTIVARRSPDLMNDTSIERAPAVAAVSHVPLHRGIARCCSLLGCCGRRHALSSGDDERMVQAPAECRTPSGAGASKRVESLATASRFLGDERLTLVCRCLQSHDAHRANSPV